MIKRQILTLAMLLGCTLGCLAQFDSQNSVVRKVIVAYEKGADGFYHKKDGALVDKVDNVVSMYAFDKKSSNLYVQTEDGNYVVVLNKEYAKIYRQSKLAPIIDEKFIDAEVERVNKLLEDRFEQWNTTRRQYLRDSVEKVRRDSLEKIRQDSIQKAMERAVEKKYMESHTWRDLPTNKIGLECVECGYQVYESSVRCEGIVGDTIYHVQTVSGILGSEYGKMHASLVPKRLRADEKYNYHCKLFADSLARNNYLTMAYLRAFNADNYTRHAENVSSKAPYGYVDSWGFDFQENMLLFDFSYTNTNKKAIRCIDIFFNIKDASGITRKTGKLRGMGPVEMFETKSWTWNDNTVNVPEGMVDLEISKITITFKDGKLKTLVKDLLYKEEE
ncbi:MAG: hypothetical protein IJ614_09510 [Prevotella sp.]|nr:hypothetical protein [Prevotella sp.]